MGGKRRIVVLIDRYLPILGGAQNCVHFLSKELALRNFDVTVLTRRINEGLSKLDVLDNVTVIRFGYSSLRIISKLWCFIAIVWYLIRQHRNYDVVFCVPCAKLTDFLPAYVAYLFTRKPYIMRGTSLGNNFDSMLTWSARSIEELVKKIFIPPFVWRRVIRKAASVVVQSSAIAENAKQYGIGSYQIIPNGADQNRFAVPTQEERLILRRLHKLPTDRAIIINTGRYIADKNQIALIKAVEDIENRLCPGKLYLLILGTTEHHQITSNEVDLKQYVSSHKLDSVIRFMDDVINVEDFLRASDIFAFPTMFNEGMSNAVLEAMLCGLPVVCSDMPQLRCLFPDERGLFFDPMDHECLSTHLIRLIDSKEARETYGASLSLHAKKHYSSERSTVQYRNLLHRIVEEDSKEDKRGWKQ